MYPQIQIESTWKPCSSTKSGFQYKGFHSAVNLKGFEGQLDNKKGNFYLKVKDGGREHVGDTRFSDSNSSRVKC